MARGDPNSFNEGSRQGRGASPDIGISVPHPRGEVGFREMPAETQSAAMTHMDRLHRAAVPKATRAMTKTVKKARGNPRGMTEARRTHVESLEAELDTMSRHPKSAMEASVSRVTETAMAPVQAVRQHYKATGEMLPVAAGEFYGRRHDIGAAMAEHYHGGNEEMRTRAELATPEWSARTTPQQEVLGASGMLHMLRQGHNVGVSIGQETADLLNTPAPKRGQHGLGFHGGHGGAEPIQPGNYDFAQLAESHPQAAAILLQHHVKESGLVVPAKSKYTEERAAVAQGRKDILTRSSGLELPEEMKGAASAMVSGMGQTGFPKAGRSMSRFYSDPSEFGGHVAHKIPSYTWNIHQHDEVMAQGTHHFLGVLAHGPKWLEAHPEGREALAKAKEHPAWSDPTSTIDVWSGRVASGLPFHASGTLGKEATNPEKLMVGSGMPRRGKGQRYGSPSDMGYFYGEEAHRQAAHDMSIRVSGVGTMRAPAHVVQSLSWYGVQGEENANMVRQGKRTMAPTSMHDPQSLNALEMPDLYGRRSRRR